MVVQRLLRTGALAALVLAVTGCGAAKQAASTPDGAEFAPASTAVYVTGVTDPASSQWAKADELLGHFPGREKLLASLRDELQKDGLSWERDVKPALGPELNLALLGFQDSEHNYVFFTKPKDEAKFDHLLETGDDPQVHRRIDGWTIFADNQQALDNFEQARAAGDSLADEPAFQDAMAQQSEDAVLRGYVSGQRLSQLIEQEAVNSPDVRDLERFSQSFGKLESVIFSAAADDDGVAVGAAYKSKGQPTTGGFTPQLDYVLPSDALAYVAFGNLEEAFDNALLSGDENIPGLKTKITELEQALGFSIKSDLLPLFSKEGAIAVYRGGAATPNVLVVLQVPDEEGARKIVDRFAALASLGGQQVRPVTIHGVEGKQVVLNGLSITALVADEKLVLSNDETLVGQTLGNGAKLASDPVYEEALDASGAPREMSSLVYLNLKSGIPYVFDRLGAAASGSIGPEVRANTAPLHSTVLYSKQDGDRTTISGFLTIK
jgi:Protein of unknown function (DUF3352)